MPAMQKELVELLKVILSKRFLNNRQINKCIPRATNKKLESKVEEQKRKKDIAEPKRKLKQPRAEPESIPARVDAMEVDGDSQEAPGDKLTLLTQQQLDKDKYKTDNWLVLNNVVVCQNARLISDQLTSADMVKDHGEIDADGNPVATSFTVLQYKKYKGFTLCVIDNNVLVGAETSRKAKNGWKTVVKEFSISMSPVHVASWDSEEYEGYQVKYSEDGVDVEAPLFVFLTSGDSTKRRRRLVVSSDSDIEEELPELRLQLSDMERVSPVVRLDAMEGVEHQSIASSDAPDPEDTLQKWTPEGWKPDGTYRKERQHAVDEVNVQLPPVYVHRWWQPAISTSFFMYIMQEGQNEIQGPPTAPIVDIGQLTAQDYPISATVVKADDGTPTHLQLKFNDGTEKALSWNHHKENCHNFYISNTSKTLTISNENEEYRFGVESLQYIYFDFKKKKEMLVRTRNLQHGVPGLVYGIKVDRPKKRKRSDATMNLLFY